MRRACYARTIGASNRTALEMIRWPGSRARGGEGEKPVILFYNDFFGGPPTIPSSPCIGDCEFTTDRRDLPKAAAVIFHIPNRCCDYRQHAHNCTLHTRPHTESFNQK